MLHYVLLACLCLSASNVQAEVEEKDTVTYHRSPRGRYLKDYFISPDTFDDNDTFVVAQYQENSVYFMMVLTLFNDSGPSLSKDCIVYLKGDSNIFAWSVTSLRRLSETKVVLTWSSQEVNVANPTTQIIVYDMSECREINVAPSLKEKLNNAIVVPIAEDEFDVVANGLQFCGRKFDTCWMRYNLARNTSEIRDFEIDLDWPTLQVEQLSNGNLKVEGWRIQDNAYRVFLMSEISGDMKNLKGLEDNKDIYQIASSEWSFCWTENSGLNAVIDCKQVEDGEKTVFSIRLKLGMVALIYVKTIRRGELMLLTKRVHIGDVVGTLALIAMRIGVRENGDKYVDHEDIKLPCTENEQEKLVIYEARRDGVRFGCKKGEGFHFGFKRIFKG